MCPWPLSGLLFAHLFRRLCGHVLVAGAVVVNTTVGSALVKAMKYVNRLLPDRERHLALDSITREASLRTEHLRLRLEQWEETVL